MPFALGLLILSRLIILCILPSGAYSQDIIFFLKLGNVIASNQNAYGPGVGWTYPPLVGIAMWIFNGMYRHYGVDVVLSLRLLNIICEIFIACGIYSTTRLFATERTAIFAVLFGIVVNPVCVVLACIHGNFDSLVAASCIWCVYFLVQSARTAGLGHLLLSGYILSFGILAKTFPLLFLPLYSAQFRRFKYRELAFTLALILTPLALSLGSIRIIGGSSSLRPILNYASVPGYFGITGAFRLLGYGEGFDTSYVSLFKLFLIGLSIFTVSIFCRKQTMKDSSGALILSAATLLLLVLVVTGPGYGPQYLFWIIPFIAIQTATLWDRPELSARVFCVLALVCLVVSSTTVVYEYLASSGLSGTLAFLEGPKLDYREVQKASTLLRTPLLAALLLLTVSGAKVMADQFAALTQLQPEES